jgi:TrmH family RNA methyltransferase
LRSPLIVNRESFRRAGPILSNIGVAVLQPEFGINLGYIARAMANFGLDKLTLVTNNRKFPENQLREAILFSAHARYLLEKMNYVETIDDLRQHYELLIGTTAIEARRKSNLTRRTLDIEECAEIVTKRITRRPAEAIIVFGRDTTGLTNEELSGCDYTFTIRTGSKYNTLNVSHAAAISFYIFSQKIKIASSAERSEFKGHIAGWYRGSNESIIPSRKERDRAVSLFEELAENAEFQEFKKGLLREALNRMFNRGDPSLREIFLLMGLASKASSKIERLAKQFS